MSSLNSNGKFNKFIMGKGFYLALAVCLVGAGAAAWVSVDKTISSIESAPLAETPPAQTQTTQQAEEKLEDISRDTSDSPLPPAQPEDTAQAKKSDPPAPSLPEMPSSTQDSSPLPSASASAPSPEQQTPSAQPVQQQISPDSSFVLPINAEIMANFSGDTLVKNVTLNDYRTHNGIDLKAAVGTEVRAACAGTVTNVSSDPLWGNVIEITSGARVSTYSGLSEDIPVSLNDMISSDQIIGQVGVIPCEISLEPHLHFMVKENGNYVNPVSLVSGENIN